MLTFGSENSEINKHSRLAPFVLSIKDDPDNRLSIVIALPKNCPAADDISDPRLKDILSHSTRVIEDTEQLYEIAFGSYVIYQCRNESYTSYDPTEVMKGKYLVIFERSHFLDYYESVILTRILAMKRSAESITASMVKITSLMLSPTSRQLSER